jgi:hypothetical protein
MKRIGTLLASATAFVLCTAVPALAGGNGSALVRPNGPGVSGSSGTAGGTAFTGANVSTGMLLVVALVMIGALALYAGRRRLTTTR